MESPDSHRPIGVRVTTRINRLPEELRVLLVYLLTVIHVCLPIGIMVAMLSHLPGITEHARAIFLHWPGRATLAAIALLTTASSIAIGAVLRIIVPALPSWLALSTFLMAAIAFLTGGTVLRSTADIIGTVTKGDGPYLLMFIGLWLATLGYLAKIPWDDARDRLVRLLTDGPSPNTAGRTPATSTEPAAHPSAEYTAPR